jgi:hypothetical protein
MRDRALAKAWPDGLLLRRGESKFDFDPEWLEFTSGG